MGEADINPVKSESEFDKSLIQNGDSHSSFLPPPGWDVHPGVRESQVKATSNVGDSSLSASPICPAPICRQFWKAGNYEDMPASKSRIQNSKNHLHVHPKFLHANATSHKWAFGAIAELLDNAIDEIQNGATYVIVDKITNPKDGNPAFLTQDDGGGMDPEAIRRCMSFGFSDKKSKSAIGRYGNGFKTSTMRLGADVIVFTRNLNDRTLTQSIGLLSYTYLSRMGLDRIVVPMVDYEYNISTDAFQPLYRSNEEYFNSNLSIILKWSPFQTEDELLKQLEDIGAHGTKIIVYNLWFTDDGILEFDFESDPEDIRLRKPDDLKKIKSNMLISEEHIGNQYRYSLRVYMSILYLKIPQNFCIILRGKVVEHHVVAHDLKYPEFIIYRPQIGGSKEEILTTIGFLKEAPNVYIHGFNVYHKNRLILPFWQVVSYLDSRGRGVVGILEANFVEPTHNKQDFERTSLFQKLESRLKEMTWEYWDYHCGLIGYQVKKKAAMAPIASSSVGSKHPRPISVDNRSSNKHPIPISIDRSSTNNNPRPVSMDKSSKVSPLLASQSSTQHQSGSKRSLDDLLSALGRGRRQSRAEPKVPSAGLSKEIQPVLHAAMPLSQQEDVVLRREHIKLREKCLAYEKSEEELEYKVSQLAKELEETQQEYKRMLIELQLLEVIKPETNEPRCNQG